MIPEIEGGVDDATRDDLLRRFGFAPHETQRLGSLMTFVFADARKVLKIVHESHRSKSHLLGEVDFLRYLARHGIRVPRPLRSRRGAFIAEKGKFYAYAFERLPGRVVERWTPALLEQWGALLARVHAASADYAPDEVRRPQWHWGEHDYFARNLRDAPPIVRRRAEEFLAAQHERECGKADYGLVHGDPHHWNLLLHDGELALIDFDDCVYGWYLADVAVALYYAVNAGPDFGEHDPVAWFRTLRDHLLRGYERVRPGTTAAARAWLPQFLLGSSLHDYAETLRLEASNAPELGFRSTADIERDLEQDRWNDPRLW